MYINIDERYGEQAEATIEALKTINPTGQFSQDARGIYEIINGKTTLVAIADNITAAALGKLGGSATTNAKRAAARENGKLGGRPKTKTE